MDHLIPFTTSGSLVNSLDKKMLVVLRDGRRLQGILRSYDQFANLVLEDTVERIYHGAAFGQTRHGVFIIRGENVVLMGEIDLDLEDDAPLQEVTVEHLLPFYRREIEDRKQREAAKAQVLMEEKGYSREGGEGDGY